MHDQSGLCATFFFTESHLTGCGASSMVCLLVLMEDASLRADWADSGRFNAPPSASPRPFPIWGVRTSTWEDASCRRQKTRDSGPSAHCTTLCVYRVQLQWSMYSGIHNHPLPQCEQRFPVCTRQPQHWTNLVVAASGRSGG